MKKRILVLFGAAVFMFLYGCSSRDLDDLQPLVEQNTAALVTFQDVKFVFENICTQCHSNPPQNGAPMPLVTFANVKSAVETRGLIDRISRMEGADGLMPLGGPRLPQATIDLIVQWKNDGLLEN